MRHLEQLKLAKLFLTSVVAIVISGCHQTQNSGDDVSNPSDIVTNADITGGKSYLYYIDQNKLVRVTCPAATVIYNRDNCKQSPESVPADKFLSELSKTAGKNLSKFEALVEQLFIKLATVDRQLIDQIAILAATNPTSTAELRAKLRQIDDEVMSDSSNLAAISQQMKAIEAVLATSFDRDLERQLAELKREHADILRSLTKKRSDQKVYRDIYIDSNSALVSSNIINGLKQQRAQVAIQLESERINLENELDDIALFQQTKSMLELSGFSFEVFKAENFYPGVLGFVERFADIFSKLLGGGPVVQPGIEVSRISAGNEHTCALTDAGAVKCWGHGGDGRLGHGGTENKLVPTDVSGLSSGVKAVSAGFFHTCALTGAGAVKCWGFGGFGQLGHGGTDTKLVPTDVSGLSSGVKAISAGTFHTCALTDAGAVKCWGHGKYGKLGNGDTNVKLLPTDVSGLSSGVKAISAGAAHTCALTDAGTVKCWGFNQEGGVVGTSSTDNILVPTAVSGLSSGVKAISAGPALTCAVTDAGVVKCWGYDEEGLLFGGGEDNKLIIPTNVSGLSSEIKAISARGNHICAITDAGAVKCLGYGWYGQLGNGGTDDKLVPTDVSGLSSGVKAISVGSNHTCATTDAGAVKCWGSGVYGQLGNGGTDQKLIPTDVLFQ